MTKHEMTEVIEQYDLLWAAGSVGLGAALGIGIGIALACIGLRWTWALGGIPLTLGLILVAPSLVYGCGSATVCALLFALGVRIADHFAGGERARLAREAIGPLQLAWLLIESSRADDIFLIRSPLDEVER